MHLSLDVVRPVVPSVLDANRPQDLVGRVAECEQLDRVLASAREGHSAVLVIRGEAGIGKTALLRYAARHSSGFRRLEIAGAEIEMELPFAAVHQLCAPLLDWLGALPGPQHEALSVAFGLSAGDAPDRFMVGLAVLGLLSTIAEERPLLCLIDDAQWLDEASCQVLAFVARRLLAECVAIVFATRSSAHRPELGGLPDLALGGLDRESARALLARAIPGRLDERIRDRIVAETQGNPLALLELPRGITATELAGGFELPPAGELSSHIESHYMQRLTTLPEPTQRLMLLAAADPVGEATVLWRAAQTLGISRSALAAASRVELLEIGHEARFHNPLVRSAAYRAASPRDRQKAHEALAAASDPEADADRRAWHRALAVPGLDEDVATELEHSAGRAQTRGGLAAAAAFLERSARLTADPSRRAQRALSAAEAKHQAGAPSAALALLASAEGGSLDELARARADVLRGRIAFTSNRGKDVPPLLLTAAKQLEPLDATLARETYLEALLATQLAGRFAPDAALKVAQAARAAPPSNRALAPDLLLDGLAVLITEGHAAGVPLVQRALKAFLTEDIIANGGFRWLLLAGIAAIEVWDFDTWWELTVRELQLIRDAGALTALSTSLSVSIFVRVFAGELAAAAALTEEQKFVTEASGSQLGPHGPILLAGWQGNEGEVARLTDITLRESVPRGEGYGLSAAQFANVLLHNGLGQYERAVAVAQQLLDPPRKFDQTIHWVLPELVEAAVRTGRTEVARAALEQLSEMTRPAGTDWSLGLEARSRALVSADDQAELLYREAVERLERTRLRGEHARARLLYGEWLRRQGRRVDAREQLRAAHEVFIETGIRAFGERASHELQATGETVRKRRDDTRDDLTPQESHIVRLAREGLSNSEIGARLFLSPRTVEWHLSKVFGKLGIRGRRDLMNAAISQPFF